MYIGLPLALIKTYRTFYVSQYNVFSPTKTEFTGSVNGLYFSSALFLGLNGLCYFVILGCYVEIWRDHRKSVIESGRTPDRDEQMRLTRKVIAIVATDFACVFPIIVLGFLVQTRVIELPASVYAWSVTIVLPINSAINPYLYTIADIISNKREKKPENHTSQATAMSEIK